MAEKKPTPKKLVPAAGGAVLPADYAAFLADLKTRVRSAQLKAAVTVNVEMIRLYWDIGRAIVDRQRQHGWGKAVVDRLAADVQREFPGVGGFSPQNVWKMRQFFLAYADRAANLSQPVREIDPPPEVLPIPWGHNMEIVFKVKDPAARLWYLKAVTAFGWSRAVLDHHIDTDAYGRKGKAVSNFATALPPAQSDLAREAVKDPFTFGFLTLAEDHAEAELQRGLVDHIRQFLLELGAGFAFVGEQVHLEVGGDDFYLDLVFYHLKLRAYVIFDLKAKRFTPEAAGKMNFYLSAVDDLMRHPADNPSIGIILCKAKNRVVAEYALRDIEKPLAVSTYVTQLIASLPEELAHELDPPDEKAVNPEVQRKKKKRQG